MTGQIERYQPPGPCQRLTSKHKHFLAARIARQHQKRRSAPLNVANHDASVRCFDKCLFACLNSRLRLVDGSWQENQDGIFATLNGTSWRGSPRDPVSMTADNNRWKRKREQGPDRWLPFHSDVLVVQTALRSPEKWRHQSLDIATDHKRWL